jgi:hypothetical protein
LKGVTRKGGEKILASLFPVLDGNADPDDRVEGIVVPVSVEPAEVVVAVIVITLDIKPANFPKLVCP